MSSKKPQPYRAGGLYQRHDHATCPPLVDGPPHPRTGKPTKVRADHKCKGTWVATIEAGWNANGTRRRVPIYARTEAEVKRKLRDKRRQIETEGHTDASARTTVKSFAEQWIEHRKTKVRGKPWATDASAIRKWIVPTIGHKRLTDLTPADRRAVAAAQRQASLSSSTARRTDTTLTGMLRDAMIDGHQIPSRVLLVDAPGKAANDRDEMPVAEVLLCLNAAYELLPHWVRWYVQILHGMRPAEVLGLTRDDIDLDAGVMVVRWQLQPLRYVDRKNKALGFQKPDGLKVRHLVDAYHLVEVKTKKGERVIPLVPAMRQALKDWLAIAPECPWGLVFPTVLGRPSNEKADLEEWYALQGTVGVHHPTRLTRDGSPAPYYIYEARHGLATRLMEEGTDEHVITAIMGHSSIVTSRGYMHANQQHALAAMERVAARLQLTPSELPPPSRP